MKTKTSWVALVALSGLLALSTLQAQNTNAPTGGGRQGGGGFGGGRTIDERLTQMSEFLGLKDEQKPKVKAILEEQMQKMQGLREVAPEERREKMTALRDEVNKKMKEVLTEEQYKKYETMPARGGGRGRGEGGGPEGRRERPGGTNAPPANP